MLIVSLPQFGIFCLGLFLGAGFLFSFDYQLTLVVLSLVTLFFLLKRNFILLPQNLFFFALNTVLLTTLASSSYINTFDIFTFFQSGLLLIAWSQKENVPFLAGLTVTPVLLAMERLVETFPWNVYNGNESFNVIAVYLFFSIFLSMIGRKLGKPDFILLAFTSIFLLFSYSKTAWLLLFFLSVFSLGVASKARLAIISISGFLLFAFSDDIYSMLEFKARVSGFLDHSSMGHFYDRLNIYRDFWSIYNTCEFLQCLTGLEKTAFREYSSNPDRLHSAYLEIMMRGGILALGVFILKDICIAFLLKTAGPNGFLLSLLYICASITINGTSSIALKYIPALLILPVLLRLRRHRENI